MTLIGKPSALISIWVSMAEALPMPAVANFTGSLESLSCSKVVIPESLDTTKTLGSEETFPTQDILVRSNLTPASPVS